MTRITRRSLIVGSLASAAGLVTVLLWKRRETIPQPWEETERYPSPVGDLPEHDKKTLWELFQATSGIWSLSSVTRDELMYVVDLKTQLAPSYLAEYQNAVALFKERPPRRSPELLVRDIIDLRADKHTDHLRLVHARQYVVAEMLQLQLIRGGFRQFGLDRYPGFIGRDTGDRTAPP